MNNTNDFQHSKNHIISNDPLQARYLYGLSLLTKADLAEFQTLWLTIPTSRRIQIMNSLVEIAEYSFEVNFEPIFIWGLSDPEPDIQAQAIEGLWESGEPTLIPPFIHLMKTGQTITVRAKAASGLGQFVYLGELDEIEDTAYDIVQQALLSTIRQGDENIEVIRRAIEAISFASHEGVPQIIESAYYHDDETMQVSAVFAMGRQGDARRWEALVLTELDNHNSKIRFEAVRAAGELQLQSAVSRLIEIIDQEADGEIQQSAVWSLGQIGGAEAREAIETLLESEDEALQEVAEEALDELTLWSENISDIFDYTIGDDEDDIHVIDLNGKH